ncbi:MAG TPA: hypothetical protein VGB59_05230 [Allosphingosinicella sp.]|jgi:predicted flap endonuclease-1-like 5' DNA nuclease
MSTVAEYNLILIGIAVLIGFAVAFWVFRAARRSEAQSDRIEAEPSAAAPRRMDGPEGNAVPDGMAAAAKDVAGQMLGVDAHPDIPGPSGPPDDLRTMKGVGPKLAAQLNENGIVRFDQLAGLSPTEVERLDERMGAFRGRIARDRLVEQACYLARGDKEGFEAVFGKLGSSA